MALHMHSTFGTIFCHSLQITNMKRPNLRFCEQRIHMHDGYLNLNAILKADLHGTTLSHAINLRQVYDMNHFV